MAEILELMTPHKLTDRVTVYNCDCMEYMATLPSKAFEMAIVDVPYGIGRDGAERTTSSHGGRKAHEFKGWDERPNADYFNELFRVSANQIIWGSNYLTQFLPPSMGWVFWDKGQRIDNSDGELAFTSFDRALRVVEYNRVELLIEGTIHPTQKPVALYRWLLTHYAKPGDRILDTHFGSLSSGIACHIEGFEYVGCELDPDYFQAACKRFREVTAQQRMFA